MTAPEPLTAAGRRVWAAIADSIGNGGGLHITAADIRAIEDAARATVDVELREALRPFTREARNQASRPTTEDGWRPETRITVAEWRALADVLQRSRPMTDAYPVPPLLPKRRHDFRVSWKRDGLRRKTRVFKSLAMADKHVRRLTVDVDPHYACDPETGYHWSQTSDPDDPGGVTCLPEIIEGPVIEQRERLPWLPLSLIHRCEHSDEWLTSNFDVIVCTHCGQQWDNRVAILAALEKDR